MNTKQQTFFAKKLSFLTKSGLPTLPSIRIIKTQSRTKKEMRLFERIAADIENGHTLAASLSRCGNVFSGLTIHLIKAGESSGTLTQNLNYLAEELKKKELLRQKVLSALLYPVIITIATFAITGLLIVYIFPKILPIFKSLNAVLPLSTRIIIFLSDTIRHYGMYIGIFLVLLYIGFIFLQKKYARVRYFSDGMIVRLPLVGRMCIEYNLANMCRTLGLLLHSGVHLPEALNITTNTTENSQYAKAFGVISRGIQKGKMISELMSAHSRLFPPLISHMVAIGESSGNLPETLLYISEFCESEFDDLTKNISSAIEPALMLMMGVIVGFVAISVITPIYEITNNLSR